MIITWRQKGWANFRCEKKCTHKKCVVTFKWLWKLDLSGQSVVSLTKWVNCLGRSQCSFSLLLLRLWCACLHFQMLPLCMCRRTESCLTGKEKKICILISVSSILPVGLIPLTCAFTPPPALAASAVAAKLFFYYVIVNIFMSLPGSMSG